MKKILLLIIAFMIMQGYLFSQESRFGEALPPRGTIRVLLVFAELIADTGSGCPGGVYDPTWLSGPAAPPFADEYLDFQAGDFSKKLTQYYKDVSLGELEVLGDYYNGTVQVPCSTAASQGGYERAAINQLNAIWQPVNGQYLTKNNVNLNDFDHYGTGHYTPKEYSANGDGLIDVVVFLWRNRPFFDCGQGHGVGNSLGSPVPLGNKAAQLYGSWGFCPSVYATNGGYQDFFQVEFFHALMGSNCFHAGGGACDGTFMTSPSSFSTAAQASASSNIVCGWDRYWLGWKGSKKQHDISALNTSNQEVVSDIENPIGEEVFVLRDLVTTGDAIRIKLPHINYLAPGNVKNQYIWIENHQLISPWDKNKLYDATCDPNSTSYKWKPGIYCYMQVGKDERTGNNIDPYNSTYANGSKDYLFPLSAEGSWDYYYNPAKKEQSWNGCLWMNKSIPYGTRYPDGSSLPNPFTGFSDQYGRLDENNDGVINENDQYNYKYQKYIGIPDPNATAPVPTLPAWGDQYDAFTQVGQKISIGTNPSSATIYTLKEGATSPMSFDNRKILLNNLSIEIINITTNSNGKQDYTVKIRWNDSEIKKSVRWCGNIILKPVSGYTPNITLRGGVGNITLDRGLSPVRMREESFGAGLTEPTFLHLMAGTTTTLKTGSFINVFNGSTFHVQAGATLILEPNTIIETDSDPLSKICIEDGANVILQDPNTSKIKINGKLYGYDYLLQNLNLSTAQDDYYALNTITTAGGLIVPNTGNVNLKAKNKIELTPGTSLAANSNQLITIEILPSPYICEPQFYNTKLRALAQNNSSSDYVETNTSIMKRSAYNSIENTTKGIDLGYLFTIYPNPSSGVFTISFPDKNEQAHESEPMNVEIYNSMGDNVYSVQNTSATTLQVDLKSQPKGVYIVRVVKNNGEIKTSKISLQ